MYQRDRLASVGLLAAALAAWLVVAWILTNLDPTGEPGVLLAGALALGTAVGLGLAPLLWLLSFSLARGIAYRGSWWRALRRAALVGLVVAIFVVLRGQDLFSLPLALLILAMSVLVEVTLSLRR